MQEKEEIFCLLDVVPQASFPEAVEIAEKYHIALPDTFQRGSRIRHTPSKAVLRLMGAADSTEFS
jgi:hypothetical protein